MSKTLTAASVANLKPQTKRYETPDGGQRGLLVVVFPSGKKSFIVRYRFAGRKRKLTLGQVSLAAARKAAASALFDVHEGLDPAAAKRVAKEKAAGAVATSVQAICEQYLKREGSKLRTIATLQYSLRRLVYPVIGRIPVGELKRSQIVRLIDKIQDQCGDRTADLALSYLRRVLAWHASRSDDFNSPIVRGMGRYDNAVHARSRVLTDAEICAIWKATEPEDDAPHPFQAFTRFLLLTGARRNEARLLTWSEIDGDKWHLPASRNKTKLDFTRPLNAPAVALLASLPRIDNSTLVFTTNGRQPVSATAPKIEIDKRSGVENWTFHDLRRTARTLMSRAGVNSDVAERCLGHVIGGVRGIYDRHEYQPEMARAFEALASLIDLIVNPKDNVVPMARKRQAKRP
jgi:integrase